MCNVLSIKLMILLVTGIPIGWFTFRCNKWKIWQQLANYYYRFDECDCKMVLEQSCNEKIRLRHIQFDGGIFVMRLQFMYLMFKKFIFH